MWDWALIFLYLLRSLGPYPSDMVISSVISTLRAIKERNVAGGTSARDKLRNISLAGGFLRAWVILAVATDSPS